MILTGRKFQSDYTVQHTLRQRRLYSSLNRQLFSAFVWVVLLTISSTQCLEDTKMENTLNISSPQSQFFLIKTTAKLPSPLPTWPSGPFGSGTIDLGGLQVSQVTTFNQIWGTQENGPDNLGATFYEPSLIPEGFYMLGSYSQPNNKPLFGWVLVARDVTNNPSNGSLKSPIDYTLVWSSESANIKQDGKGYIWLPTPPPGYKAVGHVITSTPTKPSTEKIRCVRADFTSSIETKDSIWGIDKEIDVYNSRPTDRGSKGLGVPTGTFVAIKNGDTQSLSCLKNVNGNLEAMPNVQQIQELVKAYSPWIYFHPDEQFLPSTVPWYFQNGALLYEKGKEGNPIQIQPDGSNLPQGGPGDDNYWLDLPVDEKQKEIVKKGNLDIAGAYLHIKPACGATFTDIAIWLFYPFNGPAKVKVKKITINLGKIGEHVGDWEHVTLRISNFNGELRSVFFSQHSAGIWVDTSSLEFKDGNKPVTYSSLNGHAFLPIAEGNGGIGLRNDTAKSNMLMNTGLRYTIVAADHLPPSTVVEPPWLNYTRKWGPKIYYNIEEEIKKIERFLFGKIKTAFKKLVSSLPSELFGQEGPTGPKMKDNWTGDENAV